MVDFCESFSPFHVCLTIRPSAHRANPQMKLITLYNKPSNKFADLIADLDRLLCKLTTDALITILSGDFNVNVKKRDKQSDSLLKLVQYHDSFPLTIIKHTELVEH
jgi:hypothetical protein